MRSTQSNDIASWLQINLYKADRVESMTESSSHKEPIQKLEELSLNSWPALKTIYYDGWIVRFANRVTNRSNSVWPLYPSKLDTEAKITPCEFFYTEQGQPAVFRIASTGSIPPLDDILDKRNYSIVTPTSVQTMSLNAVPSEIDSDIVVETHLSDNWFENDCRLLGLPLDRSQTYRTILESIALPCCFASINRDGKPVTVAIAVRQQDWVGLYGMFTETTYRGRGLGRKMLHGLLGWGKSAGASNAYLHVEIDNAVARGLYEKLGFHEVYRYWYRVQSPSGST